MGPLRVKEANVVAHQLQNFGGSAAPRSMAINVDEPAQFVPCRPPCPLSDQATFHPKDNRPNEIDPLSRRDMISNPPRRFAIALEKCLESLTTLPGVNVVCIARHVPDHSQRRHDVILQHWLFHDGERSEQRDERTDRPSYLSKSFPPNFTSRLTNTTLASS